MRKRFSTRRVMAGLSSTARARGKALLKTGLGCLGLELRRLPATSTSAAGANSTRPELPPIFEDPLEALHFTRGGIRAAFQCPIAQIGLLNGLTFGKNGWNPFSESAVEIRRLDSLHFEQSILRSFYEVWQPTDAAGAILGLPNHCHALSTLPPHLYSFTPWRSLSISSIEKEVWKWYRSDLRQHGFPALRIDCDGFKTHGPVTGELGQAEISRLRAVLPLLAERGYDRRHGEVLVWLLKRGEEARFVNRGGLHRTAAMDALGHETIPARFGEPAVVDIDDVDYWPQVRMGTWTREEALRYFNHLFDFDTKAWARQQGLCG